MMRELFEDYVDGALDETVRADIERAVAQDPRAAKLMEKAKMSRALRAAALASYTPSAYEASTLSSQVIEACHAGAVTSLAKIGPRRRVGWLAGIAAGLVLAVGSFTVGRMTATSEAVTTRIVEVPKTVTVYSVTTIDRTMGDTQVHEFASAEDRDAFIKEVTEQHSSIAIADYLPPGHM